MKTLQEIKDEIARRHGFKSWEDARGTWIKRTGVARVTHESYIEEAAKLYAQEACREQREICAGVFASEAFYANPKLEEKIENAPEPRMI